MGVTFGGAATGAGSAAAGATTSPSVRMSASRVPIGTFSPTGTTILDDSGFENLHLDGRLLGIDHRDDISALDRVAGFDQPLKNGADLHVGPQSRHAE